MVAPSLERLPPCGYSIMAITAAFQAEDRGSTPRTRSNYPLALNANESGMSSLTVAEFST